jgi:hypothetical protein
VNGIVGCGSLREKRGKVCGDSLKDGGNLKILEKFRESFNEISRIFEGFR